MTILKFKVKKPFVFDAKTQKVINAVKQCIAVEPHDFEGHLWVQPTNPD